MQNQKSILFRIWSDHYIVVIQHSLLLEKGITFGICFLKSVLFHLDENIDSFCSVCAVATWISPALQDLGNALPSEMR